MMAVSEAVETRRTVRAFLEKPVPLEVLKRVLDTARMTPSGCNFQPWEATVLTGEPLRELQARMQQSPMQDPQEYPIQPAGIDAKYTERLVQMGAKQYAAMGIARDDQAARQAALMENVVSFGAPVLLLCYFPRIMGPPQWSDVGMWLQTIMLLLREEGLDSCPQEFMSIYARLIKDFIGVSDESHLLFCGMGIGYRDPDAPVNNFERSRVPLDEQVRFAGF